MPPLVLLIPSTRSRGMHTFVRSCVAVLTLLMFVNTRFVSGADQCTPSTGVLEMDHRIQQEDVWCYVASSSEVLKHLRIQDPQSSSDPSNSDPPWYSQCRLYNISKVPGYDCCTVTHPTGVAQCKQVGWPDEVFDKLTPPVPYTPGGALPWTNVKGQICPGGSPGHPFIYVAHPPYGIPHTYTVVGFSEGAVTGQQLLYVHSQETVGPGPMGSGYVDYECYAWGQCVDAIYTHDGDYYDFHPSNSADNTPPAAPTGITVR